MLPSLRHSGKQRLHKYEKNDTRLTCSAQRNRSEASRWARVPGEGRSADGDLRVHRSTVGMIQDGTVRRRAIFHQSTTKALQHPTLSAFATAGCRSFRRIRARSRKWCSTRTTGHSRSSVAPAPRAYRHRASPGPRRRRASSESSSTSV